MSLTQVYGLANSVSISKYEIIGSIARNPGPDVHEKCFFHFQFFIRLKNAAF